MLATGKDTFTKKLRKLKKIGLIIEIPQKNRKILKLTNKLDLEKIEKNVKTTEKII